MPVRRGAELAGSPKPVVPFSAALNESTGLADRLALVRGEADDDAARAGAGVCGDASA